MLKLNAIKANYHYLPMSKTICTIFQFRLGDNENSLNYVKYPRSRPTATGRVPVISNNSTLTFNEAYSCLLTSCLRGTTIICENS